MRAQSSTAGEIARVAGRQHGVITRGQLVAAGLGRGQIGRRVAAGALFRVHPGVYRVGHKAPSVHATYMAAVLACGSEALLCGRAAGHLLGVLRESPPRPEVMTTGQAKPRGVRVRRVRRIEHEDGGWSHGIPVTTPARTLVDLAAILSTEDLARACHEALVRRRATPAQVDAVLARRPNSRGAAALRALLHGDAPVALSRLESRFLRLLREARLPRPVTNRIEGAYRIDCRWPEHRLTVELDGYRFHASRHAWENDGRREREAYARGDQFRRYTYGDVCEDPRLMLAELRALLAARGR